MPAPTVKNVDDRIKAVRELMDNETVKTDFSPPLITGVDLGTSNIQVIVMDSTGKPVAARFEWDDAVRDGVVVDFMEARDQLRSIVEGIRSDLADDADLDYASVGYPPGTESWVETNVVKDVGFEIIAEVDEPTAAAEALGIDQGAIVDIGGGTTGISIIEGGEVVYSADEATGGHHLSLVISGHREIDFTDAEEFKHTTPLQEYVGFVQPVIQKMASIVEDELVNFPEVDTIYLVGGTVIPSGFEEIFAEELERTVIKPEDPIRITPTGISMAGVKAL